MAEKFSVKEAFYGLTEFADVDSIGVYIFLQFCDQLFWRLVLN